MTKHLPDSAFAEMLEDFLRNEVFSSASDEARVLLRVAESGVRSLNEDDLQVWLQRVLPIVSKPLNEQAAVAMILRDGGRVPKRIHPLPDRKLQTRPSGGTMNGRSRADAHSPSPGVQSASSTHREELMRRLTAAQRTGGNLDHNIKAGAALLSDEDLQARVEKAEAVAKTPSVDPRT